MSSETFACTLTSLLPSFNDALLTQLSTILNNYIKHHYYGSYKLPLTVPKLKIMKQNNNYLNLTIYYYLPVHNRNFLGIKVYFKVNNSITKRLKSFLLYVRIGCYSFCFIHLIHCPDKCQSRHRLQHRTYHLDTAVPDYILYCVSSFHHCRIQNSWTRVPTPSKQAALISKG